MGFKDFLKRGSGFDLVTNDVESSENLKANVNLKNSRKQVQLKSDSRRDFDKNDEKVLKQLEYEVSRAIEKLEDIRDKLRVRRGY
ncbi:hypothetical protein HYT56_05790 [Candidatus Woesearchaeota archaeon]|nr:hypothetical protein [Candidatus Woesearchaeota archaeon]